MVRSQASTTNWSTRLRGDIIHGGFGVATSNDVAIGVCGGDGTVVEASEMQNNQTREAAKEERDCASVPESHAKESPLQRHARYLSQFTPVDRHEPTLRPVWDLSKKAFRHTLDAVPKPTVIFPAASDGLSNMHTPCRCCPFPCRPLRLPLDFKAPQFVWSSLALARECDVLPKAYDDRSFHHGCKDG